MGDLGVVEPGVGWYQLTQSLPVASGNSPGTSGPSSVLTGAIASGSFSPGDEPLPFTPPVIMFVVIPVCSKWRLTQVVSELLVIAGMALEQTDVQRRNGDKI